MLFNKEELKIFFYSRLNKQGKLVNVRMENSSEGQRTREFRAET